MMTSARVAAAIGIALATAFGATSAFAQDKMQSDDLRAFYGHDDRQFVDTTQMPWSAVGKVYFQSGGHCSGAVIAPRIVLTAAHCFYMGDGTDTVDRPTDFFAGFNEGEYVARAFAVSYYVPPEYDPARHLYTSEIDGFDYGFLVLDRDISHVTGMFDVHPLNAQELEQALRGQWRTVSQAGYSRDNENRLTAHVGCPITRYFDDETIFHECDTLQGDSGSPLFIEIDGRYRIIALESATYMNDAGPYDWNMAVDSRAFHDALERFLATNAWSRSGD